MRLKPSPLKTQAPVLTAGGDVAGAATP